MMAILHLVLISLFLLMGKYSSAQIQVRGRQANTHQGTRNLSRPEFNPGRRDSFFCIFTGGTWVTGKLPAILPQGDSSYAILASHHIHEGNEIKACLGYIDSNVATVIEIWDNLEIGLKVVNANYRVVKFDILFKCKGPIDIKGPYTIEGSKVPRTILEKLDMYVLKPGDCIAFENIRIQRVDQAHTIPVKRFQILAK